VINSDSTPRLGSFHEDLAPSPRAAERPLSIIERLAAQTLGDRLQVRVAQAAADADKAERLLRNLARRLDQEAPGVAASFLRLSSASFRSLSLKSFPRDASSLTASANISRASAPLTAALPGVRPIMARTTSLMASGSTRPCCRTWLVSPLTRCRIGSAISQPCRAKCGA